MENMSYQQTVEPGIHNACRFLKLNHHDQFFFEKSLIERTMQYIKELTEGFDDYFPCRKRNVNKSYQKLVESICKNTQQGGTQTLKLTEPVKL